MLYELRKREYDQFQPLFKKLEWNLTRRAIIEGASPGRVYVDGVGDPRTAFMCTVEGYYLAGDEGNEAFNASLNKHISERFFVVDTVRRDEMDVAIGFHPDSCASPTSQTRISGAKQEPAREVEKQA